MKRSNLALDVVVLVVGIAVLLPEMTGFAVHEWIGLILFVLLFAHCVLHADDAARLAKRRSAARLGKFILNIASFVVLLVCVVSGLFVSGAVLSAFGLYADGYYFWDPLHVISAKAFLVLMVVHVALHGKAVASFVRKKDGVKAVRNENKEEGRENG